MRGKEGWKNGTEEGREREEKKTEVGEKRGGHVLRGGYVRGEDEKKKEDKNTTC